MIIRKNGETNAQWSQRCQAYAEQLEENNRNLRVKIQELLQVSETTNPRTGRLYKIEAEELFITIGLVQTSLKVDELTMAKNMLLGQLHSLGFNDIEIDSQEYFKDGAYTSPKSI